MISCLWDGGYKRTLAANSKVYSMCPTPYNRKYNLLSASLNKTFPSFLFDSPNKINITSKLQEKTVLFFLILVTLLK